MADEADVSAMAALRRAWEVELAGGPVHDPDFEKGFAAWHERERHQRVAWLAFLDDRPVGMLNMLVFNRMPRPGRPDHPTQWGYVANAYVCVSARNRGVGTSMLEAAVAYADEHRFARLVLSPNERSVPFYSRQGFVPATDLMLRSGP